MYKHEGPICKNIILVPLITDSSTFVWNRLHPVTCILLEDLYWAVATYSGTSQPACPVTLRKSLLHSPGSLPLPRTSVLFHFTDHRSFLTSRSRYLLLQICSSIFYFVNLSLIVFWIEQFVTSYCIIHFEAGELLRFLFDFCCFCYCSLFLFVIFSFKWFSNRTICA